MQELIVNIAPNLASKLPDFYKALGDTMLMVLWSGLISFVFGLLLGVVLTVTKPNGILENKVVYQILDKLVSLFRSIPFIILLTWVMPITRALVGTVLNLKPILRGDEEGHIVTCEKVRGRARAIANLAARYETRAVHPELQRVAITHGDCPEDAQALAERIRAIAEPKELIVCPHEPFTGAHVGPGMLGLFFFGNGRA